MGAHPLAVVRILRSPRVIQVVGGRGRLNSRHHLLLVNLAIVVTVTAEAVFKAQHTAQATAMRRPATKAGLHPPIQMRVRCRRRLQLCLDLAQWRVRRMVESAGKGTTTIPGDDHNQGSTRLSGNKLILLAISLVLVLTI